MPRVKDPGVMALYADIATLEARREISDRTVRLAASLRGDMAGTPSNLLLNPITYQERVSRVWDGYNIDPLFQRLVNRTIEFSANGSKWEIPTGRDGESWLDKIKNWMESGGEGEKLEREEEFWNLWASRINFGVPNILPGLNEITSWAAKHLLLSGMFIPVWELGRMKFGKMELLVPVKMSCYPATAIALVRPANAFENEWSFLRLPQGVNAVKIEGQPNLAQQNIMPTGGSASGYQALPRMLSDAKDGSRESFTIKFNYTPGDLVTIRRGAMSTGETMYPPVPFASLLSQIVTRQKLFAADLAILDGIVNYIEMWKIGDKDHPPQAPQYKGTKLEKDGTIAQIRKLIQDGRVGPAMQLFVPYYVDLVIKMPESEVLLSEKKYVQSTLEIFQSFGIFFSRAQGARERMEKINIANFEEFVSWLRAKIAAFYQMLAMHIVELNPGKLSRVPLWTPNPLNTKSQEFMEALYRLSEMGKISFRTLLRYHGLDDNVELRRLANELGTDVDDVTDANVPLRFVQSTDIGGKDPNNPSPGPKRGRDKEIAIPPTQQRGRPRKKLTK